MPELPEVERVRKTLQDALRGREIAGVRLHRRDIVRGDARPRALLEGARAVRVLRHGKQLALVAEDGRAVAAHLGMTGQFLWRPPGARLEQADHIHAQWRLVGSRRPAGRIVFRDPRRFGGLWTYADLDSLTRARWARLGPDALVIDGDDLHRRLLATSRAIKGALLDQRILAGVGNIYADEALFRARLHPLRPANALTTDEAQALAACVREVLSEAVEAGGSTLRDYRDALGRLGGFQARHAVYGRAGAPCVACGRALLAGVVAQRTTVWCPACQREKGATGRKARRVVIHTALAK